MDRAEVFAYVAQRYGIEPDYPWGGREYAVLRHGGKGKWFGLVMGVSRQALGLPGEESLGILNVKCDQGIVYLSKDTAGILPAYHMNKRHWVSLLLDGTLPKEKIVEFIDESYDLTG